MSDDSDYEGSEDSWDDEEDLKDYKKGGYHPVTIGEQFANRRYRVLSKLGWGHFSTVWLAWDSRHARPSVLKLQKSAQRYAEAAKDEVDLLRAVSESHGVADRCLVLMLDHFEHRGVNGLHHVMCFEVLGPTLLSLIKQTNYQGLPINVVRRIAACVLVALSHLHDSLSIIHTDLKPENVLCCLSPSQLDALVQQAQAGADAFLAEREQGSTTVPVAANGTSAEGLSKNQRKRLKQKEKQKLTAAAVADADADADAPPLATASSCTGCAPASVSSLRAEKHDPKEPRIKQQRAPPIHLDGLPPLFKVADLGNACWRKRQFTDDIQTYSAGPRPRPRTHPLRVPTRSMPALITCSMPALLRSSPLLSHSSPLLSASTMGRRVPREDSRQYRCPEVILGAGYDISADMWSLACVLFEAASGDLLFSPKAGASWSRDEDHLALILELVRSPAPPHLHACMHACMHTCMHAYTLSHSSWWAPRSHLTAQTSCAPLRPCMCSDHACAHLSAQTSASLTPSMHAHASPPLPPW